MKADLSDILNTFAIELGKQVAVTAALTVAASLISFGVGAIAVNAVRAKKFVDLVDNTVGLLRSIVAAAGLRRLITLTRSIADTRTKLERLHDAIETAEDTVEASGKKLTPEEIQQRSQQIGEEVQSRPKDSEPRNPEYLAAKLNELNLSHDEAVEATIAATEIAFGENAGTAPAREDGTVLLPASTHHKLVMIVKPDGTVVAARGNVTDFL